MTLMTYYLSDDLEINVHVMQDGRLTLRVWDDRLKECRCWLEWDEVRWLIRALKRCECKKALKKESEKEETTPIGSEDDGEVNERWPRSTRS